MKLRTLISLPNEPVLEKWARFFRFTKADSFIEQRLRTSSSITLVDFGCGQDILYYKYLEHRFPQGISKLHYIGLDPLVSVKKYANNNVELIPQRFEDARLTKKADIITMFAVLEHVNDAQALLKTALKIMKPTGTLILTTPSPLAKFPLEFFSQSMEIIARREIEEHKRYPTRSFLLGMRTSLSPYVVEHEYFEFGLNNLAIIQRHSNALHLPFYSFLADLKLIKKVLTTAFIEI